MRTLKRQLTVTRLTAAVILLVLATSLYLSAFTAHCNFCKTTVATPPSPCTTGTSLVVTTGDGVKFGSTFPMMATVWPAGTEATTTNAEILLITARSTDTLTITRTQESSTARCIVAGDQFDNGITVKAITDVEAIAAARSAVSTTGNIAALALPAGNGPLVIHMTNASQSTIQGIAAGLDGQELTLQSDGLGEVDLSHLDGSGTALGKIKCFATTGKTPLAPGVGVARLVYDLTNTQWRLVDHSQGAWLTPTFAAGTFTASGSMTWTVASAAVDKYWLKDRTLFLNLGILGTTGGTASSQLLIGAAAWGGYSINSQVGTAMIGEDNSLAVLGRLDSVSSSQIRLFNSAAGTNWTLAASTGVIDGQVFFDVQ